MGLCHHHKSSQTLLEHVYPSQQVMELIDHLIQMFCKCHSLHLMKHLVNVLKSKIQKNIHQNIQVIIKVPHITIIFSEQHSGPPIEEHSETPFKSTQKEIKSHENHQQKRCRHFDQKPYKPNTWVKAVL